VREARRVRPVAGSQRSALAGPVAVPRLHQPQARAGSPGPARRVAASVSISERVSASYRAVES